MNYYEKIIQEKRNDNVVERYSHNGAVIEIIKTDSGKFRSRISKKGKTEETMTVSGTRMEAKRDAEDSADRLNSKEEKDNDSVEDKFRHKGCLITIVKKSSGRYAFSITQNGREEMSDQTYSTQDEAERKAKSEVDEVWSCKDNSKSYYQSIIETKNASYDTEKLAKQVKTWLSTGAYSEREIADKLEKEYNMPKSVANHILEMGKRLRAQG